MRLVEVVQIAATVFGAAVAIFVGSDEPEPEPLRGFGSQRLSPQGARTVMHPSGRRSDHQAVAVKQ
jgi:hypothetical protein